MERDRLLCGTLSLLVLLGVGFCGAGPATGAEPVTIWCGAPSEHKWP